MFNVSLFFFQVQEFFGGPKKVFLIQIHEYPSLKFIKYNKYSKYISPLPFCADIILECILNVFENS